MKVIIIGGGFAGIAAAKSLYNKLPFEQTVDITLIDRHEFTTMLPSLPDVVGGRIDPQYLKGDIKSLIPKGVKFLVKNIDAVDFNKKTVTCGKEVLKYDYLIFAPGSRTNFFNADEAFQKNLKLDCIEDALKVQKAYNTALENHSELNVVITGAGFTGLELATNMYHASKSVNKKVNFYLVEKFGSVLPMLGEERAKYVKDKMEGLGFNFLVNEEVCSYENEVITLKNGGEIKNAFFCWCSGVRVGIAAEGNYKKLGDGRVVVDGFLRVPEHPEVFVAGDAAGVKQGEQFIRRAVNYAAMGGATAGKNVAALILGTQMKVFKPVDLGWVIPLYTTSIGEAFALVKTKGRSGIILHYMICGLKNYSLKNLLAYVKFAAAFVGARPKKNEQ